jgi:ATP-dependent protease ClpP protease subunit
MGSTQARLAWAIEAASQSEAVLYLFDAIGDPYEGVTSGQFVRELAKIKAADVYLLIDSPGGAVDDALAMYNALKAHPARIHGYVLGGAHSSASVVLQAADVRNIAPQASIVIHEAHAPAFGTAADYRAAADMLERTSQMIASVYAERGGGTPEEWRARMTANGGSIGSIFIGAEAVVAGLADAVGVPTRNFTPLQIVAQRATEEAPATPAPIVIDPALIPPLATGYKPPLPADFTRLVAKNLPASKGA